MKRFEKVLCVLVVFALMMSVVAFGSPTSSTTSNTLAPAKYTAGTYTAKAQGKNGDVTVSTVFDQNSIVSVTVGENSETPGIKEKAIERIPASIVKSQSLAIDVVSGATYTSNAILEAVAACVTQAGGDVQALKNAKAAKSNVPDQELTTDVVVVGGGTSGSSAGLAAAVGGAKVIVLEATGSVGGAGAVAGGTTFSVGSSVQKSTKDNETLITEKLNYLMNYTHDKANYQLVKNFITKSGSTIDFLVKNGMKFDPSNEVQRMADKGANRYAPLHKKIAELGGTTLLETRAESLIVNKNGEIEGVIAKSADGGKLTIHCKAVILATGGFGGDKELMAKLVPDYTSLAEDTGMSYMGSGLKMAWQIGAAQGSIGIQSHNHTMPLKAKADGIDTVSATDDIVIASNAPLLWLNQHGDRFYNEDIMYNASLSGNVVYTQGAAFVVFDQATLDSFAAKGTVVKPWRGDKEKPLTKLASQIGQGVKSGYAYKGNTLSDLVKAIGMDAATTEESVARYNTMVKNKVDTDFGKSKENLMYTIEKGPFYAIEIRSRYLCTLGGLSMGKDLEVLNDKFAPIPGLFACGVDSAEWMGASYPDVAGVTLGYALTSGRIAADSAVAYIKK